MNQQTNRVPRYILLLKDLHKRTWQTHPDYAGLTQAIGELQRVTKSLNEAKRRDENRQKMSDLRTRFATLSGTMRGVIEAEDVACLHEGPIDKRVGDQPAVASYLMLLTDVLIVSKRSLDRKYGGVPFASLSVS